MESKVRRGRPPVPSGRRDLTSLPACARLSGLRLSATRRGRQGRGDCPGRLWGARTVSGHVYQRIPPGRDAGALRRRAPRVGRGPGDRAWHPAIGHLGAILVGGVPQLVRSRAGRFA